MRCTEVEEVGVEVDSARVIPNKSTISEHIVQCSGSLQVGGETPSVDREVVLFSEVTKI